MWAAGRAEPARDPVACYVKVSPHPPILSLPRRSRLGPPLEQQLLVHRYSEKSQRKSLKVSALENLCLLGTEPRALLGYHAITSIMPATPGVPQPRPLKATALPDSHTQASKPASSASHVKGDNLQGEALFGRAHEQGRVRAELSGIRVLGAQRRQAGESAEPASLGGSSWLGASQRSTGLGGRGGGGGPVGKPVPDAQEGAKVQTLRRRPRAGSQRPADPGKRRPNQQSGVLGSVGGPQKPALRTESIYREES